MGINAAVPKTVADSTNMVLTFIVPATHGCNLRCPYCYIDQRSELSENPSLAPDHFEQFVLQAAEYEAIDLICIQGHEPLLPGSFAYTKAILDVGNRLQIPTSLVTNGTYLKDNIGALAELGPEKISVSLDSFDPAIHDRQRGVTGTFDLVVDGLKQAVLHPKLENAVSVSSVLIPKKRDSLIGMPALLAEIGVRQWTINALVKVSGTDSIGGPVGDRAKIFQDLLVLQREAERFSIDMTVDDEFGRLSDEDRHRDIVDINRLRIQRLNQPSGVFRLMPDGRCSMGIELLQEMSNDAPLWHPSSENGWDFIERVRRQYHSKLEAV